MRAFDNGALARGDDGAVLPAPAEGERLVMATDGHVVSPLLFPGGDIGSLCGARHGERPRGDGRAPLWLAAGFILEEGFALADPARIVQRDGRRRARGRRAGG